MSATPFTILPSSHAPANHAPFPRSQSLEQALRTAIQGEVRFDPASRALYTTDASNYRHIPIGLVIPRDEADVIATVRICREHDAPILTRGAGTSLAGQCANSAVILDFSKYMHGMDPIDHNARSVRVQPGIVLDRVREAAELHALTFAPDPATHSRCTLGGMIGNNSCGVHGLMGGKTVDNILSLDILLYDGTRLSVGPTSEPELTRLCNQPGRVGGIYRDLRSLRDRHATEIRARFPDIPRRVSGFNLDDLLPHENPEQNFNVARALVGSEGTCAIILSATLRLVESPPFRTLVGIGFPDVFLAADAVPHLLEHPVIGLEGMDDLLLIALRRKGKSLADLPLLPAGRGFLLAEFGGASQSQADAKALALVADLTARGLPTGIRVYTAAEATRVWHIRESGLGATAFIPASEGKPSISGWEGWEDAAVEPLKLGSYLRAIFALMEEFDYECPIYGHFGQGCVHMRHNFDLVTADGILKFRQFIDRAADITLAHGGSLSGEHGDGQARAALLPKMFGPELIGAFRDFKRIWDPANRLNPGKVIDAHQPHEDLRLGHDYAPWQPDLHFALPEDSGSLASAALRCVGVGACRKTTAGAMCPSFMATGEELHSTRGRAHLLWELMQGELLPHRWENQQVKESLDLCLSCKACKSECPVSVDMATYKSEFLAHHYETIRRPLAHHAFGRIDRLARLASYAPSLVNAVNNAPGFSHLIKRLLHIHPNRRFPAFAKPYTRTLPPYPLRRHSGEARISAFRAPADAQIKNSKLTTDSFEHEIHASNDQRVVPSESTKQAPNPKPQSRNSQLQNQNSKLYQNASPIKPNDPPLPRSSVLLFPDTFNNYFHPQTMAAAHQVLADAGFEVQIPRQHLCCGRPLYDFGLLDTARQYLLDILDVLAPALAAATPIVVLEPSCASVFRDELTNLLPHDPRAEKLRAQTYLLSEFLLQFAPDYHPPQIDAEILVHGHCHHRATFGMDDEITLLKRTGARVRLLDSGCCGMAGPFGFEDDKYDISQTLANRVLLPAVRAAAPETIILTDGFSCAEQITQNTSARPHHLAELLAHTHLSA